METEEREIQLREDEQEPDGEVFLGDVHEEPAMGAAAAAELGEDVEMDVNDLPTAPEAFAQAISELDAERAGDAARPQYQPSLPGVLPPFNWRGAQLRTEALEAEIASTEKAWDEAKKVATECKKEFDDAVEQLRTHIQETHRARVDAEYQHRGDGPIAPVPDMADVSPGAKAPCWTELKTGRPCSICRNLIAPPTNGDTARHVAAAAAVDANAGQIDAFGMAASITAVTGIVVPAEDLSLWTREDFKVVAQYLERVSAVAAREDGDMNTVERPALLGRPHEVGMVGGGCRVCGALMYQLAVAVGQPDGFAPGQLVGIDCPGDLEAAAEPAPLPKPRHTKLADRQKAKQAKGTKDHGAEQRAEGKKRTAKATLKSGAKKRGSKS